MMTLGGLALAVGILVDDATVAIENISHHLEAGEPQLQAIIKASGRSPFRRWSRPSASASSSSRCSCCRVSHVFCSFHWPKRSYSRCSLLTSSHAHWYRRWRCICCAREANPPAAANAFTRLQRRFERHSSAARPLSAAAGRGPAAPAADRRHISLILRRGMLLVPLLGRDFFPRWTQGRSGCTCGRRPVRASSRPRASPTKSRTADPFGDPA